MFGFLYRMPIWIVFFAIFIVLVLYGKFISVDRVQNSRAWRILNLILIFASAIFILEMTLTSRTASSNGLYLIPFRFLSLAKINIEIYRSITMNIALFIPFGMFISSFSTPHLKIKKGIIIAVTSALFFSVAIEYAQYLLHCGETETDDVIFNTLGALVGSLVICYKSLTAKISGSRYFDINAIKYLSITFFCSWTLWSFVSYFTTFYYHLKPISTLLYILGSFAPLIGYIFVIGRNRKKSKAKIKIRSVIYSLVLIFTVGTVFIISSNGFRASQIESLPFDFIKRCLIFSIAQELGWRYTLYPILKDKTSFPIACLLNGLIYSIWLIPSFYMIGSPLYKTPVLIFVLITFCFSYILSSIYEKTKSPIVSIISNAIFITILNITIIDKTAVLAVCMLSLSFALILLSRKTERK